MESSRPAAQLARRESVGDHREMGIVGEEEMKKAFRCVYDGMPNDPVYYAADTPGKARYRCLMSVRDVLNVRASFKNISVRRAPEYDILMKDIKTGVSFDWIVRNYTQPCGHPTSAIVQADEGAAYCGACEKEGK